MKSDIISIAMGELTATFDNEVMKAVRKVGIDVDKEELLKALELHHSLVHCGECKHWKCQGYENGYGWCQHHQSENRYDDFCSYGEKDDTRQ